MAENTLKQLMKLFRIGLNKDQSGSFADRIRPLDKEFKPEYFDARGKRLYEYFMNSCHDSAESYREIVNVWQDMDLLYFNSAIMKRAIDLVADEVVQADLNFKCIQVEAEDKLKDRILKFFDNIKLYDKVRPNAENIVQYGNDLNILFPGRKGIEDIQSIDIYNFKSILQFTPYEIEQKIKGHDKFFMNFTNKERMEFLINYIRKENNNYASYFKKYILGYQVGDYVLPPWRVLHFKNNTSKSPFDPWGIPLFIHSVATYRQYDAGMTLIQAMRGANLPIDVYKISAPNIVDPVSKVNFVTDFIRQFQNSGFGNLRKEETGIGESIFTIDNLFTYDQISPNINLDKVGDLEFLRDDLIISTGIPRNLLDPSDSGFGDSGVSLIQKWKPFARMVYKIQSALLEQYTLLTKIHLIECGDCSKDDMKFLLTMPYPESQVNSELISNQKDLIDLSNEILNTLSDRLLNGEPAPPELVNTVMHEILPYDQARIDDWFKIITQTKSKTLPQSPESIENTYKQLSYGIGESLQNFIKNNPKGKGHLIESFKQIIVEKKMENIREGVISDKHYYSSQNQSSAFKPEILRDFEVEKFNLLKEDGEIDEERIKLKEYRFDEEVENELKEEKKKRKKKKKENK